MTSQPNTSAEPLQRLNAADYPVLAVLARAPAHGYDVWRYLNEHLGGVWKLGRSQVYALLSQLERRGLVHHERVDQTNFPARKVFHLTAEGRAVVDEWIQLPVHHVRDLRLEFPGKFHFARSRSLGDASTLVRNQMEVCLHKRTDIEAAMAGCSLEIERQVLAYRIGVIDATVTWLKSLIKSEQKR